MIKLAPIAFLLLTSCNEKTEVVVKAPRTDLVCVNGVSYEKVTWPTNALFLAYDNGMSIPCKGP